MEHTSGYLTHNGINLFHTYSSELNHVNNFPLDYDCLYYQFLDRAQKFYDLFSSVDEIITYCFRPDNTDFIFDSQYFDPSQFGHKYYTFFDLKEESVTTEQLLSWSASIDVIENYQVFLENNSVEISPDKLGRELIYYNCTPPWFGYYCQYSFGLISLSDQLMMIKAQNFSLIDYIETINRPPYFTGASSPPACFIYLECNLGSQNLCLDWREICDGKQDCLQGEDEEECWQLEANQCNMNEYRCYNGQCIPIEFFYDDPLNPDCIDGTDELGTKTTSTECSIDLAFRCEETTCYPRRDQLQLFSCGDGQCVDAFHKCQNNRYKYIQYPKYGEPLPRFCQESMFCLTGLQHSIEQEDSIICESDFEFFSWINSAEIDCPKYLFVFPLTPVLFNHIYFLYQISRMNSEALFHPPLYICFNSKLCPFMNATIIVILGRTCVDFNKEFRHVSSISQTWNKTYEIIRKYFSIRCPLSLMNCSHDLLLYQCLFFSKCISISRLLDGRIDCPLRDDEMYDNSCLLNDIKTCRFKCLNENKCINKFLINDKISDCSDSSDELHSTQYYLQNHLVFKVLCDGIEDMIPILIDGHNQSDETNCEEWPCNNHYTRCNFVWNCPKGEDELDCNNLLFKCPLNHHSCISPLTHELFCLSIEYINNNIIDCIGATDEQEFCRLKYSLEKRNRYRCWNSDECTNIETIRHCDSYIDDKLQLILSSGRQNSSNKNILMIENHLERLTYIKTAGVFLIGHLGIEKQSLLLNSNSNNLCHRGIMIRTVWKNGLTWKCMCPPSTYGNNCQYQNQRVTLIVEIRSVYDWRYMYMFVFMLITDENEIISHDYRYHSPKLICNTKWYIYLLYNSRPKNFTKKYNIRIDAYILQLFQVKYRSTWYYPIHFPFLPVHRLALKLSNPTPLTFDIQNLCPLNCNGNGFCTMAKTRNDQNIFICLCQPGWWGIHCENKQQKLFVCNCAPGSLCISVYPKVICICPLGRIGPRCYIKIYHCNDFGGCFNGGQCVVLDDKSIFTDGRCLCPEGFGGKQCQPLKTNLLVTFDRKLSIPSMIFLHFLGTQDTNDGTPTTIFKIIHPYETQINIHTIVNKYDFVVGQLESNYYLIHPMKTNDQHTTMPILKINRCVSSKDLFNSSFIKEHLLRRIKLYQLLCRKHNDLSCFYDEIQICICNKNRTTHCILFKQNRTYVCSNDHNKCENDGYCFQDKLNCPTISACLCRECFYGSTCQFNTKSFSISLDAILGYQINPRAILKSQLNSIKFTTITIALMFIIGIFNSIISLTIFIQGKIYKVSCGIYLISTCILSIFILITFSLKFLFLLLIQTKIIQNSALNYYQCKSLDYILRVCLNWSDWLDLFVTIDRALRVIQGLKFHENRNKKRAKYTTISLFVLSSISNIQEIFYHDLIDDDIEKRTWCITRYSLFIQKYNIISQSLHFFLPFLLNIISVLIIIIIRIRTRFHIQTQYSFYQHIHKEFARHKHIFISPIILILLKTPRLIFSLISTCIKSDRDPWLFLIGHAAPVVRRGRLDDAFKSYNQALATSTTNDERASAFKNLAVLHSYQINNQIKNSATEKDIQYAQKECITSFGHAYEYGKLCTSQERLSVLHRQIDEFVYDRHAAAVILDMEESFNALDTLARYFELTALEKHDTIAAVYYTLAKLLFKKAIMNPQELPRIIYECQPNLDRAVYWAKSSNKFQSDEVAELRRSIYLHQCIYESSNARRAGNRMLEAHLKGDECMNMDIIWMVIDKYREAILLAREHDIEGEAEAWHLSAKIYQNILKMTDVAYTYHLRCVTLAQTMMPRNLTSINWYVASTTFVQKYRAQKVQEEELANQAATKQL
ncbi:hypothetical protein I4U23_027223 [Adineta vaga]|nr:hypothetical protein I4U23_027223 [Adineta vaga]